MTSSDRARLDTHVSRCPACRATLDVGRAFDAGLGAQSGDDEIARRIADRLVVDPRRRRPPTLLMVAAVMITGSVAAANVPGVWQVVVEKFVAPAPVRTVLPPSVEPKASQRVPQPPERPVVTSPEPVAIVPSAVRPPPSPERLTAAELFAEANAARRNGDDDRARSSYQKLQRLHPGSVEALVSQVSLGRLERGRNPSRALKHFNAYLGQSSHRTLAEEALFGRASALSALGRTTEEQSTWHELLQRFPSSVYAERAKARLAAPNAE
jgi:hypothetical protein